LTLAALEATLRLYRQAPDITHVIPTLRAFTRPLEEIRALGESVMPTLQHALGGDFRLKLEDSTAQIGSGALPTEELPTVVIAVEHAKLNADAVAKKFRGAAPPILGRVNEDRFLLDLRTIFDADDVIPRFQPTTS